MFSQTTSYWQTEPPQPLPSLQGRHTTDVCIVGGGMSGLALAYWLRKMSGGTLRVMVLEARTLGQGASGRNGGLLLSGISDHFATLADGLGIEDALDLWHFSCSNRDKVLQFIAEEGLECELTQDGSVRLATYEREMAEIEATYRLLQQHGESVEHLSGDEVEREYGLTGFMSGYRLPKDARLHSMKYLNALAQTVLREGAEVFGEAQVTRFASLLNGDVELHTAHGTVSCARVVFATNAYLELLNRNWHGLVRPVRGQMAAFSPVPDWQLRGGFYAEYGYIYWQQRPDGRVLLGGFRHHALDEEAGFDEITTVQIQSAIEHFAHKHFPQLRGASVERRWAGTMGNTIDYLPLVGSIPGTETVFLLAGFSGHGFSLSFRCAHDLAELLIHGGQPMFPRYFSTRAAHRSKLFYE